MMVVHGMTDCGSWVKHRKLGTANYVEWGLLGFLSGMPFVNKGTQLEMDADGNSSFWVKNGVVLNKDQVLLWMDNYCRENPLKEMLDGALQLYRSRVNK